MVSEFSGKNGSYVILPESNKVGSFKASFKEISLEEFMKFLDHMYHGSVQIAKLKDLLEELNNHNS